MPPTAHIANNDPSNVGPHNSISFSSNLILGVTHPDPNRLLQFILDWSSVSGKKVLTLDGYVIRDNRLPDGTPRGFFTFDYRTINEKVRSN